MVSSQEGGEFPTLYRLRGNSIFSLVVCSRQVRGRISERGNQSVEPRGKALFHTKQEDTMKLTPKQEKFCELYASLGNATEAAKQAGYSEKTAYSQGQRMLKNVEIRSRIEEISTKQQKGRIADAEEVLTFFSEMMRNRMAQDKDRLRAAENLAKRMGLDKEKGDAEGQDTFSIKLTIEDLSK